MADNSGMDIDPIDPKINNVKSSLYSVNILQLVKSSQTQHGGHGGTYGDYTRYRRYCCSRLRRLYKSLKFLHGRGKYVKKSLEPSAVTDARFLHIPLYCAERSWSYFMELKQVEHKRLQNQQKGNSSLRSHLLRRLSKACKWGNVLSRLCSEKADSRTALEAEAYASYLWGTYFVEKESDWNLALEKFLRARAVYDHLSKVGDINHQVLCRQRVEELDTNIRFCNYKTGNTGLDQTELTEISADGNPALELLQSKLEVMMEEERTQQAASMMELSWCGHLLPIHDAKTRMYILKGRELENELIKLSSTPVVSSSPSPSPSPSLPPIPNSERRLSIFDKIFVTYQEAKKRIKENMEKVASAEDMKLQLSLLEKAVSCLLLQKFMERNALLLEMAKKRWERQQKGKGKEGGGEKGEKMVRLEELVRLYDILIQNASELFDLVTGSKESNEEERRYGQWLEAERMKFYAFRCFYIAHSFLKNSKLLEAYALFQSVTKKVNEAETAAKKITQRTSALGSEPNAVPSQFDLEELFALRRECQMQRRLLHVSLVSKDSKAKEEVRDRMSQVSLTETNARKGLDALVEVVNESSNNSKLVSHLMTLPPTFKSMACRPIVLDTALDALDFPSLDSRVKQEAKKTGIFNFWRR